MSGLIQSLESRTLFAATFANVPTDVQSLQTHLATLKTDVAANLKVANSDARTLTADLRLAGATNTGKKTTGVLAKDERKGLAILQRDVAVYNTTINKDAKAILASVRKLQKTAQDLSTQAKLTTQLATLSADNSTRQATLQADANAVDATATADLNSVATAGGTDTATANDVATARANAGAVVSGLNTDLTAINGVIQTLVIDSGG